MSSKNYLFSFFNFLSINFLRFFPSQLLFLTFLIFFVFNFFNNIILGTNLDEERVYLFIIVVLFFFSWYMFSNFFYLFIDSRMDLIHENFSKVLKNCLSTSYFYFNFIKDFLSILNSCLYLYINLSKFIISFCYCTKLVFLWILFSGFVFQIKQPFVEYIKGYSVFLDLNLIIDEILAFFDLFNLFYSDFVMISDEI